MVYERLVDITETSYTHYLALSFLRSFMIGKWRINDAKPYSPQSQSFGILPLDARQWAHSRFIQILPTQNTEMTIQQCPTPTGPQQMPKNHQHIPPMQINTAGIPVYHLNTSEIQALLTQSTMTEVGDTQGSAQESKINEVSTWFNVSE